ncbi:transglutaminase [Methylovorus sp. MM2]|uniref:transglutaminase TgpA family protein n=1 Tax=Methylovorus sp. MM2 TaxID=1848038 RepID=UPI0007E0A602|nr:DUF3488 and transglutaminase-like domain-containing protein [Methylovorus sp. MM2]OAM52658.1 transglutaminase [Methylovorus sp. MM2]
MAKVDIDTTAPKPSSNDLHWLLGSLTLVMAMHVSHLALWVSLLIAGFGGWRYLVDKKAWGLPKLVILIPITIAATIGIAVTYHGLFGRDASVALLALMLALKLMETYTRRDYIVVIFIAYFLTINTFLFSQTLPVGAFMLLPILALTSTLIGVHHYSHAYGWRFKTKLAGSIIAQALPIMIVFFILFPRMPGPLWSVPRDANSGMSGLSDSMEPGSINKLSLSGATAFRVEFQENPPAQKQLYWRGPVLSYYDGRTWRINRQTYIPETLETTGNPTNYTVTLEPHNRNWILMLDLPSSTPPDTQLSSDRQVLSKDPIRTRIRYSGSSYTSYKLADQLEDRQRKLLLQLPPKQNPKSRELAASWLESQDSPEKIVQNALSMFRNQPFIYTLSPPILGDNPVDDFIFNTKRGFCEHYASSFVFLMRAAGVPARVVTGYQGGELNPVNNYLIVRQSDAHAWAEVWLKDRGWVRVDPTAAVAPERIERNIAESVDDSEALSLMSRRDYPLLRKLYLNWDAANNGWNQWVLGYNQERQMQLLRYLTGDKLSWDDLVIALLVMAGIVLSVLCYFLLRGKRLKRDPIQNIYNDFLRKLAKSGLQRYDHEGPVDFSIRACRRLPQKSVQIEEITQAYTNLRYAKNFASIAAFKQLVNAF